MAILVNLSMSIKEAGLLFGLFMVQFVAGAVGPESIHDEVRILTGVIHLIMAAVLFARSRRQVPVLMRDGFRTPYSVLSAEN